MSDSTITSSSSLPFVSVIMGSDSDWPIMKDACAVLDDFGIKNEARILSAHRMPLEMVEFSQKAHDDGISVIIAGAGGAAHLPGMVAALTPLPVIGVPIANLQKSTATSVVGWDSLLSILQMPAGIPVATVAVNGAKNAGYLAVRILGVGNDAIKKKNIDFLAAQNKAIKDKATKFLKLSK